MSIWHIFTQIQSCCFLLLFCPLLVSFVTFSVPLTTLCCCLSPDGTSNHAYQQRSVDASQDAPGATENQQTAHGEGTQAAVQQPGNQISWLVLQRVVNNMKKYPFLWDDNYKDILLVCQVLHDKPLLHKVR